MVLVHQGTECGGASACSTAFNIPAPVVGGFLFASVGAGAAAAERCARPGVRHHAPDAVR
ncbi:MAG: sodium/glutamate symporter [Marinilabiliales bacterium]|nr:sodium/glutamate symporter [Marinilabiliales bacterium]